VKCLHYGNSVKLSHNLWQHVYSEMLVDNVVSLATPWTYFSICLFSWPFYGEPCPHIDVVHPDHAWASSPVCTSHCFLHYLFLQATPFPHASFLALTVSNSSLFTPVLLRTHLFVLFSVHETHRIFLSPFMSKASRRVSSFFPGI